MWGSCRHVVLTGSSEKGLLLTHHADMGQRQGIPMWRGLLAKFEAGLQVDQQSMRASVSNKTSRCNIHTSATGWLGWEKKAKVTRRSHSQTLEVFIFLQHWRSHTGAQTHTQAHACISVSVPPHLLCATFNASKERFASVVFQSLIVFPQ